jgi:ribosomal protein L37AE/L43A
MPENNKDAVCPKCNNTRMIKEKDGTIHICFDCLNSGRLDQHEKKLKDAKDFGIKL